MSGKLRSFEEKKCHSFFFYFFLIFSFPYIMFNLINNFWISPYICISKKSLTKSVVTCFYPLEFYWLIIDVTVSKWVQLTGYAVDFKCITFANLAEIIPTIILNDRYLSISIPVSESYLFCHVLNFINGRK